MQSCPTSQVTCCMCMGQGYFIGFSALIEALKVVINSGLTCPICHLVVPQIESLHTHLVSHQNQVVLVPPEQNQVKDELDQILNDVNEIVCKDQFGSLINPSVSLQSRSRSKINKNIYIFTILSPISVQPCHQSQSKVFNVKFVAGPLTIKTSWTCTWF